MISVPLRRQSPGSKDVMIERRYLGVAWDNPLPLPGAKTENLPCAVFWGMFWF
jgi:hypothetical protein